MENKSKIKKKIKIRKLHLIAAAVFLLVLCMLLIAGFALVNAQFSSSTSSFYPSAQYYSPGFEYYSTSQIQTYWTEFGKEQCEARGDFILNIRPGGCQPAVVRSDLLEERNVPVFCKLDAIKINPLIDVESIRSISFRGTYSDEVAGVGFHPANAAVRSYRTLLGSPVMNEAGYLVIVLKRQPSEEEMPDWVEGNLTAVIRYDMENAFGIGRAEFVLPVLTQREWENDYLDYGFWRGKGFLRANWVEPDSASISVYRDAYHKQSSVTLEKGKTSGNIYLGGFYCKAALQLTVKDISAPETRAKISVWKGGQEDDLWLYEGSNFLDNQCKIIEINPISLDGGSIVVRCKGETFSLTLGMANHVKLGIDGQEVTKETWQPVDDVYVAYVGQIPRKLLEDNEKNLPENSQIKQRTFIVLVKTSNELVQESLTTRIRNTLENKINAANNKGEFETAAEEAIKDFSEIEDVDIVFYGESGAGEFEDIKFIGPAGSVDNAYAETAGGELEKYFEDAIAEYRKVVQLYPAEKENEEIIGQEALEHAVDLARTTGKQKTEQELLNEIISHYPNTNASKSAEARLLEIEKYDLEKSIKTLDFIDDFYTIQLHDIKEPTLNEASASIQVGKDSGIYAVNDYVVSPTERENCTEFVRLKKLEDDYVVLEYSSVYTTDDEKTCEKGTKEVKIGGLTDVGRFSVYVSDISLKKVAHVALTPRIIWPDTETNVSFKIGIEKRGIKLSPDKTREMLGNLNESIEKWEKISDSLRTVIRGWKGTCIATSAILLVKNLLENFEGKSMARSRVMRGPGGWMDKCKELMNTEGYVSLDHCLNENNPEIERDVNAALSAIKKVNDRLENTESLTDKTIFGEKILNTEESFDGFMREFNDKDGNKMIEVNGEKFAISELIGSHMEDYVEGVYTFSDAREWMYYSEMLKSDISPEMKEAYEEKLLEAYTGVEDRRKDKEQVSGYELNERIGGKIEYLEGGRDILTSNIIELEPSEASEFGDINIEEKTAFIRIQTPAGLESKYSGKIMLVPLSKSGERYVPNAGAYVLEDDKIIEEIDSEQLNEVMSKLKISSFVRVEKGKCKNPYKNPEVRLFDVEPFKGMPGIVPFDVQEGWYAAMKQSLRGFGFTSDIGGVQAYTDAGILKNFYLCNVGKNGREEFDTGVGDDICSFVSFETGAPITHPCLEEGEARTLANKARSAIVDASRQSTRGAKKISIFGREYNIGLPVGGAEGTQCQDFMSPEDCYILFNVCDPVLCPPSRCNLGGNYPVRDVVQSGIIGSIALCLPNFREGIIAPVCLTGVHAGIDSYLSILKAERDCLQESLDTGRHIGICDEIKSIYLCEFFWRQLAPLMDVFIPKMVELAYGQGTRGGGEYLTVQHAWNTIDNSVEYLTNYYAQNAYNAFLQRSTDEAGTEVCKAFVSARYPGSKDFFDIMLEPESPVQYHAWFDEIPFTEATTPATSHYKVYYHIWAGNDIGASYSVYLREPPESSYYMSIPTIVVDTGYIGRGGYIDRTKDFTAPAGYKKLCVRVNMQEECGFEQVSTSFAVDYITEQYVKEQALQEVTSEKECISGTPSLYSVLQPNIQEGVQETISPEMYKRGIIRICSTDNPGKQTEPARWKDVGYCDNERIRCWLDIYSVEANVMLNETLAEIEQGVKDISQSRIDELVEKGKVLSEDASYTELEKADEKIKTSNFDIIEGASAVDFAENVLTEFKTTLDNLGRIEESGYLNVHKAKAIFLKAKIYDAITQAIKKKFIGKVDVVE